VPVDKHAELDTLIAEARAVASLRDERALYSDVWAGGILRTTVLAIGRRLIRRKAALLCDPADLVHATPDEVLSLLRHSRGPSATELETRAARWRAYTTRDAPAALGPKALPPPSTDLLPPGAARVMTAVLRVMQHVITPAAEPAEDAALRGKAASSGIWEGPAHIVSSHDDAKDIPAGAVLVVGAGSSSFTMLAPLASAVVAEGGGLLSHVAIVCREYRIPCVCGVPGVLSAVQTGQRLRVDGTRGVVEVMA
jgi:pyruvate,water dikinase